MTLRITGLNPAPFAHLYGLSAEVLAAHGAVRVTADARPGYPCRVTLEDAEVGETLLLLSYEHIGGATPYRGSGPIFVREGATAAYDDAAVPAALRSRLLSVRAYDADGFMLDADVVEGEALDVLFERFFSRGDVDYLHLHHARRGCFACKVIRS